MASSTDHRIVRHPILPIEPAELVAFSFDGQELMGRAGEAVSSALFANGLQTFGHHQRDGSPQGLFCANGQCSQCTLLIDGVPLKSCIVGLRSGMQVSSLDGRPRLDSAEAIEVQSPKRVSVDVLIVGGGPAGLAAAIELGKAGVKAILVDDKDRLGGKLVLQTHKFFGSTDDCYAGTRGVDIAKILSQKLEAFSNVEVWLESVVLGAFGDKVVGVRRPSGYVMVEPTCLLITTGAREKALPFPGNTLPGVYGAGAFQTVVNRDLVACSQRIFVVGGGNVGLIGAYHAIQAGMQVVGLAEAMPKCGGYKVHADKLRRLGVPIYTSHSIMAAHGKEHVEAVTIAQLGEGFHPIAGTEKTFQVDTLLVAVGLNPVNEFANRAKVHGMKVWMAGDAEEIAEASAAMFCGRIRGIEVARALGIELPSVPSDLEEKANILKSPAGKQHPYVVPSKTDGVFPVLHCAEEIPCNPCMTVCPKKSIRSSGHPILGLPVLDGPCDGCMKCVAICPGLAISLVDYRKQPEGKVQVTIPYELGAWTMKLGDDVTLMDWEGAEIGTGQVRVIRDIKANNRTTLLKIEVDESIGKRVAGIRVQTLECVKPEEFPLDLPIADDAYVCRCERVKASEIREAIRSGVRDLNQLKGHCRSGMGACGGKTCAPIVERICREEGVGPSELTPFTQRAVFAETQLGYFVRR